MRADAAARKQKQKQKPRQKQKQEQEQRDEPAAASEALTTRGASDEPEPTSRRVPPPSETPDIVASKRARSRDWRTMALLVALVIVGGAIVLGIMATHGPS